MPLVICLSPEDGNEHSFRNVGCSKKLNSGQRLEIHFVTVLATHDRLCGLVVRVLGYRSGGPGLILGITIKK
jgi:hypothetical protein